MALKSRLTSVDAPRQPRPLYGPPCQCMVEFFREEFRKHHQCLERQREYRLRSRDRAGRERARAHLQEMEQLCQREDACELVGQLLRQFDVVTKLSAWNETPTAALTRLRLRTSNFKLLNAGGA